MALLTPGTLAPDFTAPDQEGNPVHLRSLRGQKIVLYFYPKDSTPTCTTQACDLRDNLDLLTARGYTVLGVSIDTVRSHQRFAAKQNLPFRLLADPEQKLVNLYGVWGEKMLYGRTYMGTWRVTYLIDEKGRITDVIEKVESKRHTAQILERADAAQPAKKRP